jgi:serine/threonine protein kinase
VSPSDLTSSSVQLSLRLEAGTQLGPYEIVGSIGAGGMGEVYRARDARLNRTVAIKVLAGHVSERPDLRARFEREAQTLASLSHAHFCPVFDVGRHDGTDYIVIEYIEGRTLADRLARGALPPDEAVRVAIEIADALDNAHHRGIIHRELKPGNIMLTRSGAKLLDFGLAKLKHDVAVLGTLSTTAGVPATAEGTILGTIQYMAPEQLEGKEADARTDIFGFGAVLHEMITGKKAFEGTSHASLIAAILDRDPPSMSIQQPATPPPLIASSRNVWPRTRTGAGSRLAMRRQGRGISECLPLVDRSIQLRASASDREIYFIAGTRHTIAGDLTAAIAAYEALLRLQPHASVRPLGRDRGSHARPDCGAQGSADEQHVVARAVRASPR